MIAAGRQVEQPIVRLYPRRAAGLLGWLSLGLFLGPVLVDTMFQRVGLPSVIPKSIGLVITLAIAPLVALLAGYLRVFGLSDRASLAVEDRGLTVVYDDGARRIDPSEILYGFVKPAIAGATVELELSRGRLLGISVPSLEAGDRLLDRLGLDARRRRARISLGSPGRRIASGILVAMIAFVATNCVSAAVGGEAGVPEALPFQRTVAILAGWVLVPWAIMRVTRPAAVVLGSEGVTIERPLRTRFIAYAAIDSVEVTQRGLVLRLDDGTREVVGGSWTTARQYPPAIAARIRAALRAQGDGALSDAQLTLLARQERTIARWRDHLRAALTRDRGYRGVAVRIEDLARVLESDASTTEQKLGAALALKAASAGAAEATIRIAAERAASRKFRVALERIAEGADEDAAIEEALAETAQAPRALTLTRS